MSQEERLDYHLENTQPLEHNTDQIYSKVIQYIQQEEKDFVWNNEPINLKLEGDTIRGSSMCGEGGMNDQMFILYLLQYISIQFIQLKITCQNSEDGDLLLVEFAEGEQEYASGFIKGGQIYFTIADDQCTVVQAPQSSQEAFTSSLLAFGQLRYKSLRDGSQWRLYPESLCCKVMVPRSIARVLYEDAQLITKAIQRLCIFVDTQPEVPLPLVKQKPETTIVTFLRMTQTILWRLRELNVQVPQEYDHINPLNQLLQKKQLSINKEDVIYRKWVHDGMKLTVAFELLSNDIEYQNALEQSWKKFSTEDAFDHQIERCGFWESLDANGQKLEDNEAFLILDQSQINSVQFSTQEAALQNALDQVQKELREALERENKPTNLDRVIDKMQDKMKKLLAGTLSDDDSLLGSDVDWNEPTVDTRNDTVEPVDEDELEHIMNQFENSEPFGFEQDCVDSDESHTENEQTFEAFVKNLKQHKDGQRILSSMGFR